MKRIIQIFFILCLVAGCTTVKQTWNNFTAYYNTFYNAKQFYQAGLKSNRGLLPEINPQIPIRVHVPPSSAGQEEFEEAIERGASIMRDHEKSRFVNPALGIIGRSYFYRMEYFSALEKFQELYTVGDNQEKQEAVLWQGRTYLEMENYAEGIRLLEEEKELIDDWNSGLLAEVHAVLGQLYIPSENWSVISEYLQIAIPDLEDRELKARALFLHGQVLERQENHTNALFSYSQAGDISTDYDLEFNAFRKEAEISRSIGSYQRAVALFRNIERDDKFSEYRVELQYEIARTQQLSGEAEEALEMYREVLADPFRIPTNLTKAKTYFGIAEIYRDNLDNFEMAAAYFDSASTQNVDAELLPEGFNAREQAISFGEYAGVKQELTRMDSLLYLGSLEPEKLDSVLAEIQQAKMEELENERRRIREQQNRMVTLPDPADSVIEAGEETEFGFLNINNRQRLTDASLQFQAVWGERPLVNNWRRSAVVSGSRFDPVVLSDGEDADLAAGSSQDQELFAEMGIDLNEIPASYEQKEEMRGDIENLNYNLANIFFLSLDMPDSARVYYEKVMDSSMDEDLVMRSMYSISEIEILRGNREEAGEWSERLISRFPNSPFSKRIAERMGRPLENIDIEEEEEDSGIESRYYEMIQIQIPEPVPVQKAINFQNLARESSSESQPPLLLFDAAKEYIRAAQLASDNPSEISQWFEKQYEWTQRSRELEALKDSAQIMLSDSALTENEITYWEQIADSSVTEPEFSELFPFEGTYWDSTRSVLAQIENMYASSSVIPQVRILQQTLEKPETPETPQDEDLLQINPEEEAEIIEALTDDLPRCIDEGIEPDGGIEAFSESVRYPEWAGEMEMTGEVLYRLEIHPDGSLVAYEQIGGMDRNGIPQAMEVSMEGGGLSFSETNSQGQEEQNISCIMAVPVDL